MLIPMQNSKLVTITNSIIAVTLLMYVVQISMPYGTIYMGLNSYFITGSLWWQPLSTMFSHGGIGHLLMNMRLKKHSLCATNRQNALLVPFALYRGKCVYNCYGQAM